jgi:membrane-bound lytic murein transglycosylase D
MSKNRNIIFNLAVATLAVIVQSFVAMPSYAQNVEMGEAVEFKEEIPIISDELIADRLSCLEKDVKLTYNKKIRGFIDYFTVRNRRYTVVMERRKNLYFPIFEEALKRHNMPDELKYLSIVESGLNPKAISKAGAAGLWQFMPSTGKSYKLNQDAFIDERLDPYKSTDAACVYLKDLYRMFGDWQLALASYNCGPGNVRRAIRKSGYKDGFWGVYDHLPQETRGYVPQFIAVTYAMNYLEHHNIFADSLEYPMQYDTIMISQTIDLQSFADQLNVCLEDLVKLNPSIKKNIVPDYWKMALRVPADKMDMIALNRSSIMDSSAVKNYEEVQLAVVKEEAIKASAAASAKPSSGSSSNKITYVVKSGDNLGKIASKHGVTTAEIKKWNNMNSTVIQSGQKLTIFKSGGTSSSSSQVAAAQPAQSTAPVVVSKPSGEQQVYKVQPGDTLWSISKSNNVTVEKIKQLNNLKNNEIKVGMKLLIG